MKKLSTINYNRKKELEKYLKNKSYPDYIKTLDEMISDPKTKALIDEAFGGDLGNIKLKFSEQNISVKRLLPTQNEIGLESSLKHGLTKSENIKKFFSNKPIITKFPLVTFNSNYVIDGHHRWSEVLIFNPDAKMTCIDYSGDMSPIQMLKATQGAIAASMGDIPMSKRKGKDLYECSKREIEDYVKETITDSVINELINNIYNLNSKDEVIDYIVENCINLRNDHPIMKYAPDRDIMPQAEKAGSEKETGSALNKMKNNKVYKV